MDGMELQILVKDKNKMMVDTDLGHASFVLGAHLDGTREHFIDLWKPNGRRQGQLLIEVRLSILLRLGSFHAITLLCKLV